MFFHKIAAFFQQLFLDKGRSPALCKFSEKFSKIFSLTFKSHGYIIKGEYFFFFFLHCITTAYISLDKIRKKKS